MFEPDIGAYKMRNMTSDGTPIILEGGYLCFGETTALTLILPECLPETDLPVEVIEFFKQYALMYMFEFTSGATPTALTIYGVKNTFTPKANTQYFVRIIHGFVTYIEVPV